MNLHAIVSGAIGSVNHHEMVTIYRCTGLTNTAGVMHVTYTPQDIMAQVQAPNAGDLKLFDNLADARHVKKFYINASASTINRHEETAGDIIERADGSYWLIDMIRDDFSPEGWLCVIGTLQHEPPEIVIDGEGGDDDEPDGS
jgi:phage terminase large subunit-like protein